jgi:hypothetical protein
MQKIDQILHRKLCVAQHLCKQAGANRFARVNRDDGCPPVGMPQEVMTTSNSQLLKSGL